ncbi:3-oxoacyl-[acyl-carrier-protein] synthase-3 [Allocatelliglobosispora scoriae]|uniref:3-oxoacyl-[acyl-carrier-protein] synthase-3 n=1 Tax=Allocatelliglobosispora scoriae TaxID=643052 RepID=A0A841BT96_9ACTN|nr:3-oxoacyl-[acyl-carrier-protein] synthase III C-terminal domain-containing protein [Allocatelliglobosispora scoriae]MBB5870010.1 3-oxoacyl-[acyl-carrier-protein] synthase-3 [Allocatelliglobosispora scoriae]
MTSVVEVASYLPPRSISLTELFEKLSLDYNADVYERYFGFQQIRQDPGGNLAEQLCAAASRLTWLRGREHLVRYVVYAPTIQSSAPYPGNPVLETCLALGLERALPFSLSQHACASALLAIDTCGRLLASDGEPDALALILTGEKTFTPVAQVVENSAVMGEGIAAVLVRAGGERDRMLSYASRTLGEFHEGPFLTPELDAEFQRSYTTTFAEVIHAALAHAGLTADDVTLVLAHNVNRMSWMRVLLQSGLPKDRLFLDNQRTLGHCFGADPFLSLQAATAAGRLREGDYYVMTASGLGSTTAAMVFQH